MPDRTHSEKQLLALCSIWHTYPNSQITSNPMKNNSFSASLSSNRTRPKTDFPFRPYVAIPERPFCSVEVKAEIPPL